LPPIQSASKYKPRVSEDSEQRVAGFASRKLSNGDVRGAVGIHDVPRCSTMFHDVPRTSQVNKVLKSFKE